MARSGRPVRVGIDATPMLVSQYTGTERYAAALIRELAALLPTLNDMELFVYLHAGNPYASGTRLGEALALLCGSGVEYRVHRPRRGYGLALSGYAIWDRLDLLHMLRLSRAQFHTVPYLLTVHDVKSVALSEEGKRLERAVFTDREAELIRQAAGLITVSESTARDLKNTIGGKLPIPVRAIHHGVDEAYFCGQGQAPAMREKYGLGPYIFFIGTLQYRKNLPRLIAAFAQVKREHQIPHKLVLAGRDGWGAELVYQAVAEHGMETEVVFPGYVPEEDLPGLYAGAALYAYPSLHEGFGIPILEAMASGTFVLTANVFSMPEVAGDAAILIDPEDTDSIADGMFQALSDRSLREELIAKGKLRAKEFTWQRTAESTVDFYHSLAEPT